MIYVIDIDGTVCTNTYGKYEEAIPFTDRIKKINKLFDEGNKIIFFTARGMDSLNGNIAKVYEKYYVFTNAQLLGWGLKFHQLILGKPAADFYVDDKGVKDEDFF
jgi:hypothetical protein